MVIKKMGFYESWMYKTKLTLFVIGLIVCGLLVSIAYAVSKFLL